MILFKSRGAGAIAVLASLALLSTGCANEMPEPISAGDLTTADIKDSGDKLTPDELVEKWEKGAEETCAGDINKDEGSYQFVECSDAAIMWSFADANDTLERVRLAHDKFQGITTSDWLVGPNWIINNASNREALFKEIGGVPVTVGD